MVELLRMAAMVEVVWWTAESNKLSLGFGVKRDFGGTSPFFYDI